MECSVLEPCLEACQLQGGRHIHAQYPIPGHRDQWCTLHYREFINMDFFFITQVTSARIRKNNIELWTT